MHFLSIAPLALGASAFLIPAEINEHIAEITKHLPSSSQGETIRIECVGDKGCPVGLAKHLGANGLPTRWTQVQKGRLEASIAVKDNKVLFNGAQVWLQSLLAQAAFPLSIKQKSDDKIYESFKEYLPISTSLEYKDPEVLIDDTTSMTIHPVSIEILAVMDQVVHTEKIELRVAETEAGVGLLRTRIRPYVPSKFTDSCQTVWCRVKGTIAEKFNQLTHGVEQLSHGVGEKINKWRGCAGRKGPHGIAGMVKGGPKKFGPGSTLHPHHKGPHGHHHHRPHGFVAWAHWFTHIIIFPVFWGLTAGSILGAFVFLIANRVRARRAQYMVVEQIEVVEEGRASMDGPPKYEEVYREPQTETEDEKKELLQ